eukprot:scaffold135170_cov32-Tisochrysis_lutea.AAC.1
MQGALHAGMGSGRQPSGSARHKMCKWFRPRMPGAARQMERAGGAGGVCDASVRAAEQGARMCADVRPILSM